MEVQSSWYKLDKRVLTLLFGFTYYLGETRRTNAAMKYLTNLLELLYLENKVSLSLEKVFAIMLSKIGESALILTSPRLVSTQLRLTLMYLNLHTLQRVLYFTF